MISLSAPTYDINGTLRINARVSNPYDTQRRGNVTATLDGGVSVYDTGYSDADQILKVSFNPATVDPLMTLRYLIAYYPQLLCSCHGGMYSVVASFTLSKQTVNLQMRVITRLDS